MADLPRDRAPAEGTRFNVYIDRPYRPLYGEVWRRDESAYIEQIVEVPDDHSDLAQKIVNDIFGQTCNFPSAKSGCSS
ncbi:hypothetical protein ACIODT_35935 [Streptomyces sp. NPDC088251]|uniref:hypothetical protein n=1 Tax=unclassified Streptomyces TaxID=2593676 RepID=UPI00382341FF